MQLMYERYMSGQVRGEEGGATRIGGVVGQGKGPVRVDFDALGITARRAGKRQHAPAVEIAGDLVPEHVREFRHLRVEAAADQDVGEVDPGRPDVDDRALWFGNVS